MVSVGEGEEGNDVLVIMFDDVAFRLSGHHLTE